MDRQPDSLGSMVMRPGALFPVAMAFLALVVVLGHVALYGVVREADEGAAAHLWQLLMAGQIPVLGFFVLKWLPRAPRQTLPVLALQAGAFLVALAPVFLLKL
jgi:hypothetical protein